MIRELNAVILVLVFMAATFSSGMISDEGMDITFRIIASNSYPQFFPITLEIEKIQQRNPRLISLGQVDGKAFLMENTTMVCKLDPRITKCSSL